MRQHPPPHWATLVFFVLVVLGMVGWPAEAGAVTAQSAEPRFALVISNARYSGADLPVLRNTYSDGDRIAEALTLAHFSDASGAGPVTPRHDLTDGELKRQLNAFADRLKAAGPGSFGFVYYSGHGAALGSYGDTVVLGVDQSLTSQTAYVTRARIADMLLSSGARTVVVVLDMCRSVSLRPPPIATPAAGPASAEGDSTATTRGGHYSASSHQPEQGYLVAFSTSPDQAAFDDGVFSSFLAEEIVRPRQNIAEVFKRVSDRVAVVHSSSRSWQKPTFDYGLRDGGPCFTSCDPSVDSARFYDCANCPWMRVVPQGEALIGSPADQVGRDSDEPLPHKVRFDYTFAVSVFDITVTEWKACELDGVCKQRPSWTKDNPNPLIPATHLSFADAQDYVNWLSQKSGKNYRLPTEEEWEYAARAGSATVFSWGDDISPGLANYDHTERYRNSSTAPYEGYPEAVTNYPPNGFGLVQMEGNVWQWTAGCEVPTQQTCARHVLRGGSFESAPRELRLANRFAIDDHKARDDVGLRVVRDVDRDEGF